jgi:hypothetical protein
MTETACKTTLLVQRGMTREVRRLIQPLTSAALQAGQEYAYRPRTDEGDDRFDQLASVPFAIGDRLYELTKWLSDVTFDFIDREPVVPYAPV